MHWSPSVITFYAPFDTMPSDAVEIPDSLYAAVVLDRPPGKYVVPDKNGMPTLSDAPALTLSQARAIRVIYLTEACQSASMAGFFSSALGQKYKYSSQLADIANLQSVLAASNGQAENWTALLMCADSNGNWQQRAHSPVQMQQVNQDYVAFQTAQQQRCDALVAQVQAAETVAAVQAIVWQ
ncbi:hypothetical protein J9978_05900 [Chromobacterium violaceum]|uniref:DUF4376 domain-containing protein n=1 Tax=Chromobacterium violaceum TaxID=536 RepID=UPI001B343D6E|nr:hypothetical protein [Chromobacterium violaceum]MBP4049032.1 hypothetical protein [Chromobacterium violaceum]